MESQAAGPSSRHCVYLVRHQKVLAECNVGVSYDFSSEYNLNRD